MALKTAAIPRTAPERDERHWGRIFLKSLYYLIISLVGVTMLYPFLYTVSLAFTPVREMFTFPPALIPAHPTLEHLGRLITEQNILLHLGNTLFIMVVGQSLALFFNSLAGFVFAKYQFRFKNQLLAFILGTMLVPTATMLVPSYMVLTKLKLANTFWGLIIPGMSSAFSIFMMRQFMLGIPDSLLDAGRIDGCSEFGLYWRIALPVSQPILAVGALLGCMGTWNDFFWPAVVLRSENLYTLALKISTFYSSILRQDFGLLAAGSAFMTVPMVLLFLIFNRQFVAGLTGSLKE